MEQEIKSIKEKIITQINNASNLEDLENIRIEHLGRKGTIAELMKNLKDQSVEQKRVLGPAINNLKKDVQELFEQKKDNFDHIKYQEELLKEKSFDVTAYSPYKYSGSLHPYTYVIRLLEDIFITMGYEIVDGNEIENDYYNFTALNIPHDHPARDMQDTFWLNLPKMLMRTHTSSVQAHVLEDRKPPIAIATLGRVYRNESTDATHDFMFWQTEMLYINKNVSLAQLLGTIKTFLSSLFKKELNIRTRPSYFPFTEPSLEVDMSCPFCQSGCSICKKSGWIEIGGAGLVHPSVLKYSHIDPEIYSGFAFGFGITRLAMLKYGINDIRLLHSDKLSFLNQF